MGPYAFSQAFLCGFFAFRCAFRDCLVVGHASRSRAPHTCRRLRHRIRPGVREPIGTSAATVADAQQALQTRAVCGALNAAAMRWLFSTIGRVRARPYVWFVTTVMAATVALILTDTSLLGGRVVGVERAMLPWGRAVSAFTRTQVSPVTVAKAVRWFAHKPDRKRFWLSTTISPSAI